MSSGHWMVQKVDGHHKGVTLERYLKDVMRVSGRRLQRLTRCRGIKLNGKRAFLGRSLKGGETVAIKLDQSRPQSVPSDAGVPALKRLFEDEWYLIVDKPPGLKTHRTSEQRSASVVDAALVALREAGEPTEIHAVHRLDAQASGILVLAKNGYAHQRADELWRSDKVKRSYLALVKGEFPHDAYTIDARIARDPTHRMRRRIDPTGQDARTQVECVGRSVDRSLLRAQLDTGRTHQIRVHLAHIAHPLVGDRLYGGPRELSRPALHAHTLFFPHPMRPEPLELTAPVPGDLLLLISQHWPDFVESLG